MALYESILSETTEQEFVKQVLREAVDSRVATVDERSELSDRLSGDFHRVVNERKRLSTLRRSVQGIVNRDRGDEEAELSYPFNWVLHEEAINWNFLEALVKVYGVDVASSFVNFAGIRMESTSEGLDVIKKVMSRFEQLGLAYPAAFFARKLGMYEKAVGIYVPRSRSI